MDGFAATVADGACGGRDDLGEPLLHLREVGRDLAGALRDLFAVVEELIGAAADLLRALGDAVDRAFEALGALPQALGELSDLRGDGPDLRLERAGQVGVAALEVVAGGLQQASAVLGDRSGTLEFFELRPCVVGPSPQPFPRPPWPPRPARAGRAVPRWPRWPSVPAR